VDIQGHDLALRTTKMYVMDTSSNACENNNVQSVMRQRSICVKYDTIFRLRVS